MDAIVAAAPVPAQEWRDRGMVYEALECFRAALEDFRCYVERAPQADDADEIRRRMATLREQAAKLN